MSLASIITLGLFTVFVPPQDPPEPIELEVGKPIEVTITGTDPPAHTVVLDRFYGKGPHRAKHFVFEVEESGLHHVDVKAEKLTPYVILRDEEGRLVTEDEPGKGKASVRLVRRFEVDREYRVEVAGLAGAAGSLRVGIARGAPSGLTKAGLKQRLLVAEEEDRVMDSLRADRGGAAPHATRLNDLAYELTKIRSRAAFRRSRSLYERALALRRETLGPRHRLVAVSLGNLALMLQDRRDYAAARSLLEEALSIREEVLGSEHVDVATTLTDLGGLLYETGDYAKSVELFERALEIREDTSDADDLTIATVLNNLGLVLSAQGKDAEARPLYERALAAREKSLGPEHPRVATSLNNLALLLQKLGDHAAARPLFERALAIREKALGPAHPRVTSSLNNLAGLLRDMGDSEGARALYTRALEMREKLLGPGHPAVATTLANLGVVLEEAGEAAAARPLYERALAIREKAYGPEHPHVGRSLEELGTLLRDSGDLQDAEPLLRRGLEIIEKRYGPESASTSRALAELARLYRAKGDHVASRPLFARALAIREKVLGPDHVNVTGALNDLGGALLAMGDYSGARPLFARALAVREKALGSEHVRVATCLHNLGLLHRQQRDLAGARSYFSRALSTLEKCKGPEDPAICRSLISLGLVLRDLDERTEARVLLERALAIREKALGREHPDVAVSLNALAGFHWSADDFESARPLYARALAIREKALRADHPGVAIGLNNLAIVLQETGDFEAARPLFERALAIREKILGPEHPDVAFSLKNLASLSLQTGDFEAAWRGSERALLLSRAHLDRNLWSMPESSRLLFAAEQLWWLALHLAAERRLPADGPEAARSAYESVIDWKGRVGRGVADIGHDIASLSESVRADLGRLRTIQSRLSDHALGPNENSSVRENTVGRLREEKLRLEEHLFRELKRKATRAPDVAALAEALPEGSVLIDFLVHRDFEPARRTGGASRADGGWAERRLSAWVLGASGAARRFDLGRADLIEEKLETWLAFVRAKRAPDEDDEAEVKARRKSIHALLWEPLAEAVGDAEHVIISPDGSLGAAPLEVIQDESGRFLIEKHAFTYVGDAASLVDLKPVSGGSEDPTLLAAGSIDYRRRADLPGADAPDGKTDRSFDSVWTPLLYSGPEVRSTVGLHEYAFEEAGRTLLEKKEATEERIKREMPGHRYIHLATHGFFAPEGVPSMWEQAKERSRDSRDAPADMAPEMKRLTGVAPGLLSGVVLAGANEPEEGREGGILTAEEITWMDLSKCELVVLSACESGLGTPRGGEGMIGLRRSFRIAGAKSVISSLWKVDDASTAELMKSFYTNLWIKKLGKMESLRQAQLAMLEKNRREHRHPLPGTWGAFVLDGDWR